MKSEKKSGGDHGAHLVEITMIVNGQPIVIKTIEQQPLRVARQKGMEETKNLAQPPENWGSKTKRASCWLRS
ncbi:DUF2604 domain-containing protein [Bradyrhizobium sp. CB3481]|uniref:DUF2604 domain-containing protein n=1 Tax=Bradyrhizobium sp. CB3481 TaxID=3039158 RepID=UPI0024B043D7|nr:DUF2604 domain-containing protein [Bradyrhizobium sp. CB3481]WFU14693.1 DUF2604 domain-containing protein [Bradyrhizobium sp. CB3481]